MLTEIHPKLPMRNKKLTKDFYVGKLGFQDIGTADFDKYLIIRKENIEIHFFEFKELDPAENYGQVYIRTNNVNEVYQSVVAQGLESNPPGGIRIMQYGQMEFSLLDPDNNLLTFGQAIS